MYPGFSLYHDDERDVWEGEDRQWRKRQRNRDLVWLKRDGTPITLAEMDDDHLLNTVALLGRKAEAWQKTKATADAKGFVIPEPRMYDQPLSFWSDAMLKELNRRSK